MDDIYEWCKNFSIRIDEVEEVNDCDCFNHNSSSLHDKTQKGCGEYLSERSNLLVFLCADVDQQPHLEESYSGHRGGYR